MSAPIDLSAVGTGFEHATLASQQVFRNCLAALSRPGRIVELAPRLEAPGEVHLAAAALLLTLLDHDTRLWLSPGVRTAGAYLRFHTGCGLADEPRDADFALIASGAQLPALGTFRAGSDERPDRSATLVIQVDSLSASEGWRIGGPGIREPGRLAARGLGPEFALQWALNHAAFPRGVDVFLASRERLCGLPRTTRIES